jgi:hypothetical protein
MLQLLIDYISTTYATTRTTISISLCNTMTLFLLLSVHERRSALSYDPKQEGVQEQTTL